MSAQYTKGVNTYIYYIAFIINYFLQWLHIYVKLLFSVMNLIWWRIKLNLFILEHVNLYYLFMAELIIKKKSQSKVFICNTQEIYYLIPDIDYWIIKHKVFMCNTEETFYLIRRYQILAVTHEWRFACAEKVRGSRQSVACDEV
jgi:hypothetical protein